jgi:hypothetical protein
MAFNNFILYMIIYPEYFQSADAVGSFFVWLMLMLNILFPLGLLTLIFLYWKGIFSISKYSTLAILASMFIVLQILYFTANEKFFSTFMTQGISETIDSIWLFSVGNFIFFLVAFVLDFKCQKSAA